MLWEFEFEGLAVIFLLFFYKRPIKDPNLQQHLHFYDIVVFPIIFAIMIF